MLHFQLIYKLLVDNKIKGAIMCLDETISFIEQHNVSRETMKGEVIPWNLNRGPLRPQ